MCWFIERVSTTRRFSAFAARPSRVLAIYRRLKRKIQRLLVGYVLTADNLGLCTKSRQEKHLSVRSLVRSFRKIVNEFWKVTIPEIQPVLQT